MNSDQRFERSLLALSGLIVALLVIVVIVLVVTCCDTAPSILELTNA